jgi:hypothetical protein
MLTSPVSLRCPYQTSRAARLAGISGGAFLTKLADSGVNTLAEAQGELDDARATCMRSSTIRLRRVLRARCYNDGRFVDRRGPTRGDIELDVQCHGEHELRVGFSEQQLACNLVGRNDDDDSSVVRLMNASC